MPCPARGLWGRRQELKLWIHLNGSKIVLRDGAHIACRAQSSSQGIPWPPVQRLGDPGVYTYWVKYVSALADGPWPGLCWRWTSCTWTPVPGYHTTSDQFPEHVPLFYERSHILFLKLYSPLIQFLIIIPYHAQCVSAALRKLSLVVNLTPANSQGC